ncbi:MAG TPA: glycosyltransferase family 39 protein, partial [Pyrinomonadaceae bacterium]|nr:glycosyltransferase family 39 protein [Pyrinomonadaceae bacterium]
MKSLVVAATIMAGILSVLLAGAQGAGAAAVCTFAAGAAALLISRLKEERDFLLVVFFGGLALRMFCGLMIYYTGAQEFFGGDALTYDFLGAQLLKVWQGETPYHVFDQVLGVFLNRNWGMIYIVGGIYSITGQNGLAVQYFCAVLGAATAPVVYLCAVDIYNNRRAARLAAYATAFFPSLILWSSQGLKDGPLVFLLALSMLATLRLGRGLKVAHLALLAAALFGIFTLRFYVFYMMAASVAGAFLIGAGKVSIKSVVRQVFIMLVVGLAMIQFGVLRSAGTQLESYGNLEAVQRSRADLAQSGQSGFGRDVDVSTTSGALSAIPLGAVYLLFAPFPWQLAS